MAQWTIGVKATKDGKEVRHGSFHVEADTESQAIRKAEAEADRAMSSYQGCKFSATTVKKIRD